MKPFLIFVALLLTTQALAHKPQVTMYSEALCPDCRHVFKDVIMSLWKNGLLKHVNFTLVASGNASLDEQGELECQHGVVECILNTFINCAIAKADSIDQWLPYVGCVEENADTYYSSSEFVRSCAVQVNLDYDKLYYCYSGDEGKRLSMEAHKTTLSSGLTYVPLIEVNGDHTRPKQLGQVICSKLKNSHRPKVCNQYSITTTLI